MSACPCGDRDISDSSRVIDLRSRPFSQPGRQRRKKIKNQSSDCGHGLGPLQGVLLLNTLRLTVWRRLLPAPGAARSLWAVLAVQGRRQAHRHIHTVDRDRRLWRNSLPVALGLLVRWRERVPPADNRHTPVVWKCFLNVPFQMYYSLFTVLENDVAPSPLLFSCCNYCFGSYKSTFMSLRHLWLSLFIIILFTVSPKASSVLTLQ